jgi:hypothetical protein
MPKVYSAEMSLLSMKTPQHSKYFIIPKLGVLGVRRVFV